MVSTFPTEAALGAGRPTLQLRFSGVGKLCGPIGAVASSDTGELTLRL
jgi:hypothetical protein